MFKVRLPREVSLPSLPILPNGVFSNGFPAFLLRKDEYMVGVEVNE